MFIIDSNLKNKKTVFFLRVLAPGFSFSKCEVGRILGRASSRVKSRGLPLLPAMPEGFGKRENSAPTPSM